ncbi:MAG: hypothetical protein ABIH18_03400, partial [Candidatus Omnitrophota bacterium]
FIDSAVKPSASPRGEPQNDKFEVFCNRLIEGEVFGNNFSDDSIDESQRMESVKYRVGLLPLREIQLNLSFCVDSLIITPQNHASSSIDKTGGIDFRFLPIVTQAMTNLSANISSAAINRLRGINLDIEWHCIERMVDSGIFPSNERIKEYLQSSCIKGDVMEDKDKVVSCISDILRQDEEQGSLTDPMLRDILVVLESVTDMQKLKEIFLGS